MTDQDQAELQALLMGYLDGELDEDQRARVEAALEKDAELRRELDQMRQLKELTAGLGPDGDADNELDAFWGGVYNRLERRAAWILLVGGFLILVGLVLFLFFESEATPFGLKAAVACICLGALLLLWSVWRERCRVLPHDRYSREVHR
ncbi:MAG: anti-sigma factor family protein [Planctomycetota bacterium]|jgi:ferric-dicitrate binding protein FerR (iron transport regulator)